MLDVTGESSLDVARHTSCLLEELGSLGHLSSDKANKSTKSIAHATNRKPSFHKKHQTLKQLQSWGQQISCSLSAINMQQPNISTQPHELLGQRLMSPAKVSMTSV